MKTIPFNYTIPADKQRPMDEVMAEFEGEAAGILNWLIEGYQMAANGGIAKNEPAAVSAAIREYRMESDIIEQFLEDECLVTNDEDDTELKTALHSAYNRWANRWGLEKQSKRWVSRQLGKKGFEAYGRGSHSFRGLQLRGARGSKLGGE